MSRPEDNIVFEDLHGVHEDKPVTVDLDAATKDDGITRAPAGQAADDDAKDDDRVEFDDLRSARRDEDDDESDDDAADAKDAKDDKASKGGEDDDYSKKVKARIDRERRAKTKERQRAEYWENQARQLAKERYDADKSAYERTIEQADSAMAQTEADLEKAIEDGQTKDQVRLTKRLSDLKAEKVLAESRLENLSPDGNVQPFDDKVSPKGGKSTPKKLSDEWMDDRSDWYGARGFERQTRLANRIDKEVFKDGYDPSTPEYFEELDRRIKEREPSLYEDLDAADDTGADDKPDKGRGKKPQQVVAPVGGNETRRQRTSGSKVELGEADFQNMRKFGLDPNDPEVLKEYARNKAEAEGARR